MKKPTSRDVAKLAGVSQSTVSFVLNSRADMNITEQTRRRVFDAAIQLGYVPNLFAQGLKTNKSKLLGLMVPTISNPFYPLLIQSIEEYAATKGYNILLCNTYRNVENEEKGLRLLQEKSVDGILYGFTPHFTELVSSLAGKTPLVIIGEKNDELHVNTIALNSFKAGEMIASHLADMGHRDIAFISSPLDGFSFSRQKRLSGIIAELERRGLEKNLIIKAEKTEYEQSDSSYEIETGYTLARQLLGKAKITAIIGVNDMVALGAVNALRDSGLRVPEDVSVCGFDNIYLSRVLRPRLTTVDHFVAQRSRQAVDVLLSESGSGADGGICSVEYDPSLIVRESTGPVRVY